MGKLNRALRKRLNVHQSGGDAIVNVVSHELTGADDVLLQRAPYCLRVRRFDAVEQLGVVVHVGLGLPGMGELNCRRM